MIFKQEFDTKSSTYTYIIASAKGREAVIIDPVIENVESYIKILNELNLKLVKVIDTHIHADHVSGLNELNKRTNCTRIMGEKSKSEVIDLKIKDNEKIYDIIQQYEIDIVVDAMKTGWYEKPYYYVEKFQNEFAEYHDRKFGIMTPNCTTAIHLLLKCLGVGEARRCVADETCMA